ncbi:hypothetical protein Vadar_024808 [Vaccinium darrowii]|uniref:Uncharacterized protein n=1 Tax=Vaccinium darrowii TaxID=229202 RepID=A0ACB7Y334_9ERIC|nr:hypothetical protein Vadar_024808 [Vaccinium darrowii]
MPMSFNLNPKWVTPIRFPLLSNSASWSSLSLSRCRDMSYDSGSVPFAFFMWQNENLYGDPLKAHKCSSTQQTLEKDYLEMEGIKMTTGEDNLQGRKGI